MWFFVFLLFFIPGSLFSCPDPVTGPQEVVVGVGSCLFISCRYDLCQAGSDAELLKLFWIHRPYFDDKSREFRGQGVTHLPRTPRAERGGCDLVLPHVRKEDGGEYGLRLVAQGGRQPKKQLLWMHPVTVKVTDTPPAPHLWPDPAPIIQDLKTSFGCWVAPTCPEDTPTFSWEGPATNTAGAEVEPWTPPATVTSHPAIGSLLTFNPYWYHDGTLLNCTIRGPDGKTIISRASRKLQVNHSPRNVQVEMSPSRPVQEGEEVTLSCLGSAKPPSYIYSWSLGGRTLPQRGAQLLLRPVQAADGGSYRCQAINEVGTTESHPVLLEVYYAPRDVRVEVTPAPPVREGGEVTLSCVVSSHPPPHTVSWSLGGQKLPHGGARLPLGPIMATHGGSYRCEATNDLGTATSPPTTLEVYFPPRSAILENLTSLPALIGSRVTLRCTLGPAHPEPFVQWERDGREVGSASPALSFDADPAHAGLYRCIGRNAAGSALSPPLPVVVWYPPRTVRVLQTPGGPVLSGGGPVSLRCQIEGGEPPKFEVTWYKEGGEVPSPAPPELLLPDPQPQDAGTYVCQARNQAGGTRSAPHPLDVHFAPQEVELVATPGGGVEERSDVTLRCRARSRPPPRSFGWFREGAVLGSTPQGLWVLRGVGVEASGRYRCSVTNDVATRHSDDVIITVHYSTSTILRKTFLGLGVGLSLLLLLGSLGCFLRRRLSLPPHRWLRQMAADEEPVVEPSGTFFLRHKKPHTPGSPRPPPGGADDADDVSYSSVVSPPGAGAVPRLRGDTVVYTVLKRNDGAAKLHPRRSRPPQATPGRHVSPALRHQPPPLLDRLRRGLHLGLAPQRGRLGGLGDGGPTPAPPPRRHPPPQPDGGRPGLGGLLARPHGRGGLGGHLEVTTFPLPPLRLPLLHQRLPHRPLPHRPQRGPLPPRGLPHPLPAVSPGHPRRRGGRRWLLGGRFGPLQRGLRGPTRLGGGQRDGVLHSFRRSSAGHPLGSSLGDLLGPLLLALGHHGLLLRPPGLHRGGPSSRGAGEETASGGFGLGHGGGFCPLLRPFQRVPRGGVPPAGEPPVESLRRAPHHLQRLPGPSHLLLLLGHLETGAPGGLGRGGTRPLLPRVSTGGGTKRRSGRGDGTWRRWSIVSMKKGAELRR